MKTNQRALEFLIFFLTTAFVVSALPANCQTLASMSVKITSLDCVKNIMGSGNSRPLSSSNISINDPRGSLSVDQRDLIAGVISRAQELGAGQLVNDLKVNIQSGGRGGHGCASYTSIKNSIELTNNCGGVAGDATVKHFTHELGHIIGLRGFYDSYNSVPRCRITNYGMKNRHEEFAEVIATYLLAPDKLKSSCPNSYAFVQQNGVFRGGSPEKCNGTPGSDTMMASNQNYFGSTPVPSGSYTPGGSFSFAMLLIQSAAEQAEAHQRTHVFENYQRQTAPKEVENDEAKAAT